MNTDTPRTDEWETYCDECYYHMWRVRRKNERGFNDGFHVPNGEGARQLVELLNKQDSELTAARAEISHMVSDNGNMYLETFIARNQRDRLAEAITSIASGAVCEARCIEIAREALQSITTKDHE